MTYTFCLPFRTGVQPPPAMLMIPDTFQSYYINNQAPTNGDGLSIDSPWQNFTDYKSYATTNNIRNFAVLNIADAGWYGNLSVEDVTALSENILINAPFATFGSVNFNFTGQPTNVFLEKSTIIAGHIRGNIVLSKESFLFCEGEVGTGGNGSAVPVGTPAASTRITFDNRADLNDIYLSLNIFRGSIDFSTSNNGKIHIFVRDWIDNSTLTTSLATLPDASKNATNRIRISGRIEDRTFPRPEPILALNTGLPARITGVTTGTEPFPTGTITLSLFCNDTFNVVNISHLLISNYSRNGARTNTSTVTAGAFSKTEDLLSSTIQINQNTNLTPLGSGIATLQIGVRLVLLYDDGQTNVTKDVYFHFIQVRA